MWYFYVSDLASAPEKITRDYGRVGALIAVSPSRGPAVSGCSWIEIDPSSITDAAWDEATQTLIDGGARFNITWRDFWGRWTDAEQDALFDLAPTNTQANRLVERIRMNLADPENNVFNVNGNRASQILDWLVAQNVLTSNRVDEIKGV